MAIYLLEIGALLAMLVLPLFYHIKRKTYRGTKKVKAIRIPKNYNDTSDAHYAINENGFLEEINHDKFSRHAH